MAVSQKTTMIPAILLGELLFWSPLIVTGLLALLVDVGFWAAFAAIYGFWVWLLPAIPIQIAFILLLNKLFLLIRKRKNKENK
jgi:hypothetical protein